MTDSDAQVASSPGQSSFESCDSPEQQKESLSVPLESESVIRSGLSALNCPLPTPLRYLNHHLHGGFPPNSVTEIFGPKSAFKTQFALSVTVQAAIKNFTSALILDSDAAIHKVRITQLVTARAASPEDARAALARLHIIRIADWNSFIALLHLLPSVIARTGARLVVLDSISTLYRTCDNPVPTKRLEAVSARLHQLAVSHGLYIILTNGARTDSSNTVVSAMGDSWRHCIGTRIMLQRDTNVELRGGTFGYAYIIKSIFCSSRTLTHFTVDYTGVTDFDSNS